ncbi:SRPBCC family protein [Alicyclobacillus fodiniaquatilis]|uniref:SRPBCC family protein n=1 Tax=Alicyclobacillus fodiniaquatilis TaxID=1661150 RepID=A0ABW4JPE1_9BACL
MNQNTYLYVTYIATTSEKLWRALTEGEFTSQYFFSRRIKSDWQVGAPVHYHRPNGDLDVFGEVLAANPYTHLSYTWSVPGDVTEREEPTRVTFDIESIDETTVKLTLKHENLLPEDWFEEGQGFYGYNNGWPAILSNLKTYMETGKALPPIVAD